MVSCSGDYSLCLLRFIIVQAPNGSRLLTPMYYYSVLAPSFCNPPPPFASPNPSCPAFSLVTATAAVSSSRTRLRWALRPVCRTDSGS